VQDAAENGTLIVSMALYFDDCPRNHSAFEERVAMTLVDAATVARATDELRDSLGWAAVNASEAANASGPGVDSFWVFEMETVVRCPSRVPLLLLVTAAAETAGGIARDFEKTFGRKLHAIGEITADPVLELVEAGGHVLPHPLQVEGAMAAQQVGL
jgi:hypothetical protein